MKTMRLRSRAGKAAALALLLSGACGQGLEPRDAVTEADRVLDAGQDYASSLIRASRAAGLPDDEAVIALGYLERLRLGLGSPFRLIDGALRDPRLPPTTRRRLGWALLERTAGSGAYEIDAGALDRIGAPGRRAVPGVGRYHLALIEDAVAEARDPRAGELVVRLAYSLAAAEGSVSPESPRLAAQAAALVRDRELARADAAALMQAANEADPDIDPLSLIPLWRAQRAFHVERPPALPVSASAERRALELAPRLAGAIRALGPRLGLVAPPPPADTADLSPDTLGSAAASDTAAAIAPDAPPPARQRPQPKLPPSPPSRPLLEREEAARLAAIADSTNLPPQSAVVVSLRLHQSELLGAADLPAAARTARKRFLERARTEELLAAEHALLYHSPAHRPGGPARAVLRTAVSLRAFAQEAPWFPGAGGPSAAELEDRFGLAAVQFAADVPERWRPYYRSLLGRSLADLHRVLPSLDLRGLRIRFAEGELREGALAAHSPAVRTIVIPPSTGVGSIAHEIAHDLDWQVALKRYRVRGDYGTDRAMRVGGDPLGRAVAGLSRDELVTPSPGVVDRPMHALRPAEVFARSVDWMVVVALAREGRTSGYLSSAQDDLLTGYGTLGPPDVSGRSGAALVAILDEVAPVYPETRRWFLERYGPSRALAPYDLLRRALEEDLELPAEPPATIDALPPRWTEGPDTAAAEPVWSGGGPDFTPIEAARAAALAAVEAPAACVSTTGAYDPAMATLRHRLVASAIAARARGLALRYAERLGGQEARAWAARELYGVHWPARPIEPGLARAVQNWAERARELGRVELPEPRRGFQLSALPGARAPVVCG